MSKRVQFITCDRVKDYYGITSGLYNSASFVVDFLNHQPGMEAVLTPVTDSNGIDKVVTQYDPDIVVIEALWVPPYKFEELLKIPRHKKRKWIVRIHSKAPFLANEGSATKWIHAYTKLHHPVIIAPNTKELTEQLHSAFPKGHFLHLPNIYKFKKFNREKYHKEDNWLDIGCFGAIRPMKNNYQQALAAIEFAEKKDKRLKFHINSSRIEQSGESVVKNLRELFNGSPHRLVEHSWYKHDDFLKQIAKMDVGMQVSFSESFNIVTADFVNVGVPIVASDDIEWMPWFLKTSPTSHKGMVRKLNIAYSLTKLSKWFQLAFLKIYNFRAKITWLAALK